MTVRILTGDCRHVLPQLPAASVHCIVTSPPYWGARDYGVPPDVWGGAADCAHEWEMQTYYLQRHSDDGNGGNLRGSRHNQRESRMGAATAELCRHCGAWRGVLGMEPLHDCGSWAWGGEPCNICYVCHMRRIFAELWRVLRDDGTCWINLGDTFYGGKGKSSQAWSTAHQDRNTLQKAQHQIKGMGETRPQDAPNSALKPKDLAGIPWRVALALQADGYYLRMDNVWGKDNPMPESARDRPTKAHEYVFLLSKKPYYFCDMLAIREPQAESTGPRALRGVSSNHKNINGAPGQTPHSMSRPRENARNAGGGFSRKTHEGRGQTTSHGEPSKRKDTGWRNRRSVWRIAVGGYKGNHYAVFPPALPEICIRAGASERGCCPKCKAPWKRIVERSVMRVRPGPSRAARSQNGQLRTQVNGTMIEPPLAETIGWQPSCQCNAGSPIPCTVLDPFGGAGTTGLVADRLGRDAILIELNEEYAEDARRRIAEDAGMFAAVDIKTAAEIEQGSLF